MSLEAAMPLYSPVEALPRAVASDEGGRIEELSASLLGDAAVLRKWGADAVADAIEHSVAAYRQAFLEQEARLVSLATAAAYSGYSADHIRRLTRKGSLRAVRKGRQLFYEVGSLPCKPSRFDALRVKQYDVAADARQVIARRFRGGLHETQEVTAREGQ